MTRTPARRLAEVAKKVGVSEATVSRVLNGKAGVSDSTRESVLTALDVLGYERPTKLRGERARLVGLVLPELQNPIFPALAEVIGGALAQRGFTPVLCTRTAGGLSEADYVDMLLDQHASGVVFAGGHYAELAAPHDHYRLLHRRGIPVMVDAASEHIEKPSSYLVRGADMVIYSGGKFLRGPQTSGLLLGRKDLIQAAWRNASPHQGAARGMKVSKEDVIGVLAALEVWFEHRDPAAELARWNADVATIAGRIALPGVSTEVIPPKGVVRVPRLVVRWDAAKYGFDGETVRLRLLDGDPRVMLDDMAPTANSIEIDPFGLQPGEAEQVGRAIAAVLSAPVAAKAAAAVPKLDVSGAWDVQVSFLHGERSHRLTLRQQDGAITGNQRSPQFEGPVNGSLDADGIHLIFQTRYEGATIFYQLDGAVADGRMQGRVTLGSASDHHKGPLNMSQFGAGQFEGMRAGGV